MPDRLTEWLIGLRREVDSEIDYAGRDAVDAVRLGLADNVEEELRLVGGDLALHRRCNRLRGRIVALLARRRRLRSSEFERQVARLILDVDEAWIATAAPDELFHVGLEDGSEKVLTVAGRRRLLAADRHALAQQQRGTLRRWRAPRSRGDHGRRRQRPRRSRGPPLDGEDEADPDGSGHVGRRRRRGASA